MRLRSDSFTIVLAVLAVLAHVAITLFAGYGIFRDELYYIACSKRLAFGYVDHPPLSIAALWSWRQVAGESLFAIRLLAALFTGAGVWMLGGLIRDLGGSVRALVLGGVLYITAPIMMAMGSFYSMNVLDALFWLAAARMLLRAIERNATREWLLLGLLLGAGCMNKISVLWLCFGVAVLLLWHDAGLWWRRLRTPGAIWPRHERAMLAGAGPWLAAGVALLLFLPFVAWNIAHDFAHVEFMRNAGSMKYGGITRADFLINILLIHNPLAWIMLGGGLWMCLSAKDARFKSIGVLWVVTFLILLANGSSKPEYLTAATGLLFAAGAVWLERWSANWLRLLYIVPTVLLALALTPFAAPVLPVETFIAYNQAIAPPAKNAEGHRMGALPQFFADMHGWEELARNVSAVYRTLPAEQRADAVVLAGNYGEAAALEYFASRYPLPQVICTHNNYWLWGYPERISTVIVLGGDEEDHRAACDTVRLAEVHTHPYAMPYESDLAIWVCEGLRVSAAAIWSREKRYI